MNNLLLLTTATLLLAPCLSMGDELANVRQRGSLICGTLGTAEPFSFTDPATRELRGYDVDFCKAIARKLSVELELKLIAIESRIPELTQGNVDLLVANLGYSEKRAEQVDFSRQYFVNRQRIMVRKTDGISSFAELADKTISVPRGSSSELNVRRMIPKAKLIAYQDPSSAFTALIQNKVDGMAIPELASMRVLHQPQFSQSMALLPELLASESWCIGIKKGENAFRARVDEALDEMERSGEGERIFNKWFGSESPYKLVREFRIEPLSQ